MSSRSGTNCRAPHYRGLIRPSSERETVKAPSRGTLAFAVWYQKRFLPSGQRDKELFHLDLKPDILTDSRAVPHEARDPSAGVSPLLCCQRSLHGLVWFSRINGDRATLHWAAGRERPREHRLSHAFRGPVCQPGRVPKRLRVHEHSEAAHAEGLGWLKSRVGTKDRDTVLRRMLQLRQLHCVVWTECVWLIADASQSETKFIVSDHPVTVYNRRCGPRSIWCRGFNDPDIWLHGIQAMTHGRPNSPAKMERLEGQARDLVRFLATGGGLASGPR